MRIHLETQRLILRDFTEDDLEPLIAMNSDPEVMRYISGGTPDSRELLELDYLPAYLEYHRLGTKFGFWVAIEKATGNWLGWFHFRPDEGVPDDEPELGYRLVKSAWGKGYGTEASRALIDKGFADGAKRITAFAMTVNTASRNVMEKCGMTLIRTFHGDWPVSIPGDEHGDVEYAITREEWEARKAASG